MTDSEARPPGGPRGTDTAPRRAAGDHGRWRRACGEFVAVPAQYAVPRLSAAEAAHQLQCPPDAWADVVGATLPAYPADGGPRYDANDVFNLGLHSGSRRSMPELAVGLALRFARQDPRAWARERHWELTVELRCRDHHGTGEWWAWPPADAGDLTDEVTAGARQRWTGSDARAVVTYRATAVGRHARLVSARLRDEVAAELARPLRYVRMPFEVRDDASWMTGRGLVDCVSGSRTLATRLAAAGFDARTRTGWLVGPHVSDHSWVEVRDEDGAWKCVDVAYHHLARTLFGMDAVAPEAFAGSRPDRLVDGSAPLGTAPFGHRCGAGAAVPEYTISAAAR